MGTLIVFCSKHGTTEKAANKMLELLNNKKNELIDLRKNHIPEFSSFNNIIIGGSIHAGMIQGRIKKFCEKNMEILQKKQIGLFLCCMEEGEKANEQFDNAFPLKLREISVANGLFGGEFIFERMNFFEKMIVKKVSGISESTSKINVEAIEKFVQEINNT